MFTLTVTVEINGITVKFTSEPMAEVWADILLIEFILQATPFKVVSARKVAS